MSNRISVGMAQINPIVGDLEGNADLIEAAARKLGGCDLVVTPELSLLGYYPWDLLEVPEFLRRQDEILARLATRLADHPGMVLVGCATRNPGPGKPLFNSLVALEKGSIREVARKRLLPTYNIFDERRHFEPGVASLPISVRGIPVGVLICEDGWNDGEDSYLENPIRDLAQAGARILVMANASPAHSGKLLEREARFGDVARRWSLPLVYVNQVGGNDDIVFDGGSFACSGTGEVAWRGAAYEIDSAAAIVDSSGIVRSDSPAADWSMPVEEVWRRQIVLGLRDYMRKCGFSKIVLGISGGIDSAVTLALAAQALGPENVAAISMPSRYSSSGSVDDSAELCSAWGIPMHSFPIEAQFRDAVGGFSEAFGADPSGLAAENLQARIRGQILMAYSNHFGNLLLSTGNKSELSVGYATLYGDMNGGLNLIGDLYKTEVYRLARHLAAQGGPGIPEAIIRKAPSAELAPGQRDQDSLPDYPLLDAILKLHLEKRWLSPQEIAECEREIAAHSDGQEWFSRVWRMLSASEFKRRQAPPIIRVHPLAFGPGRRMPLAQRFRPEFPAA